MKQLSLIFVLLLGAIISKAQPITSSEVVKNLNFSSRTTTPLLWSFVDLKGKEVVSVYESDVFSFLNTTETESIVCDHVYSYDKDHKPDSLIRTIEFTVPKSHFILGIYITSKPISIHQKNPKFVCDYVEVNTMMGNIPDYQVFYESPKFLKKFDYLFTHYPQRLLCEK